MNPPSPTKSMIGQLPHSGIHVCRPARSLQTTRSWGMTCSEAQAGFVFVLTRSSSQARTRSTNPACIPPVLLDESQSAGVFTPLIPPIARRVWHRRDSRVERGASTVTKYRLRVLLCFDSGSSSSNSSNHVSKSGLARIPVSPPEPSADEEKIIQGPHRGHSRG
jgi:hypothetical protein